jgi:hypothetical protein
VSITKLWELLFETLLPRLRKDRYGSGD